MGIGSPETEHDLIILAVVFQNSKVVPRCCEIAGGSHLYARQTVSTNLQMFEAAHSTTPPAAFAIAEPTLCLVNFLLVLSVNV
jgi:hypothetical protein